jgi:hypothetical protein
MIAHDYSVADPTRLSEAILLASLRMTCDDFELACELADRAVTEITRARGQ